MKRLVVRMQLEYEVPDHAVLRKPAQGLEHMLFIHGRYLEPFLTWEALDDLSDDGSCTLARLDEDGQSRMESYLRVVSRKEMRLSQDVHNE